MLCATLGINNLKLNFVPVFLSSIFSALPGVSVCVCVRGGSTALHTQSDLLPSHTFDLVRSAFVSRIFFSSSLVRSSIV